MNGRIAKKIRSLFVIDPNKDEDKRVYRRMKKIYSRVPNPDKKEFLLQVKKVREFEMQRHALEKSSKTAQRL